LKKQPAQQDNKQIQNNRRNTELKGLLFIAAGLFMLASCFGLPTGFAGTFLRDLHSYGFGLGAFLFPVFFIAIGIGYFYTGKCLLSFGWFWAAILFYLCLLGLLHHIFVPLGYETQITLLPEGGGIIGGIITLALHSVAGPTGAVIILIGGMLAGLVLTGKLSLASLTSRAGDKIQNYREERKERIGKARSSEKDSDPETKEKVLPVPVFRNPGSENKNSDAMDVYNKDDFAEFNEDVRKQSAFKKILSGFGQKNTASDTENITDDSRNVPVERMANHIPGEKEKPSLIHIYPEKQETKVLRPASGTVNEDTEAEKAAPWIKTAPIINESGTSIPISHYGEVNDEQARTTAPEQTDIKRRFVLTPFGVSQVTDTPAKTITANTEEKISNKEKIKKASDKQCPDTAEAPKNNANSLINSTGGGEGAEPVTKPDYIFPPLDLLNRTEKTDQRQFDADIKKQCETLVKTLKDFKVNAEVIGVTRGPSVTRYELEPAPGVKVSSVVNLADDIALRLAAPGVRVEAPIPGKAAIGIEAPNIKNDMVSFREVVDCKAVRDSSSKLCVGLGKDISGNVITIDLSKMPHLLVAGSTGSGKSVCVNTLLAGIMYKARPDEVKLILVDPKVVELTNYNGIPHLLVPVVTDAKKAASALHWAVAEMERRYKSFADTRVRDIKAYNAQASEKMPFIVIVIDEMSDLMMVAKADVEDAILRLAQKARACGIHLVLATQRPSVDVITGIVKANIPSRIAFAVSSQTDSRTILDMGGAEKLLGKGDMLYYPIGSNKPLRVQGAFVSDEELNRVTDFIKNQAIPVEYSDEVTSVTLPSDSQKEDKNAAVPDVPEETGQDELLDEAIRLVLDLGQASSSMLQRRFRIGYNRAARLVDTMEELGIVGPAVGSKPRELRLTRAEIEDKFLSKISSPENNENDSD